MVSWGNRNELAAIRAHETERAQQARFLQALADKPEDTWNLVRSLSQWGDQAPTLPAGALMGLARAGVTPESAVGRSVIRNGVPAMSNRERTERARAAALEYQRPHPQPAGGSTLDQMLASGQYTGTLTDAPAAQYSQGQAFTPDKPDLVGDPNYGEGIGDVINRGVGRLPGQIQRNVVDPINQLGFRAQSAASGGTQSSEQIQQMGLGNPTQARAATRVAGAAANDALRVVQSLPTLAAAATMTARGHPEGGTVKGPWGTEWTVGSISDALDPDQLSLVQFAKGKSLGSGYLPGGEATAAAQREQREAGMINGHALTYGRVIAGALAPADSRINTIISGTVDGTVAVAGDPSSLLAGAWTASSAAGRTFAATADDAILNTTHFLLDGADPKTVVKLREWAGRSGDFPLIASAVDGRLPSSVVDDVNFHSRMSDELSRLSAQDLDDAERETVDLAHDYIDEASGEYLDPDAPRFGLTADNPDAPRILRDLRTIANKHGTGDDLVDAIAAKIRTDYGSAREIADLIGKKPKDLLRAMAAPQAGIFYPYRMKIKRESALTHLNGDAGRRFVTSLAGESSFVKMRAKFPKETPAEFIRALTRADSDDAVRAIYQRELGANVAGPPGYRFVRPLNDTSVRLLTELPQGGADLTDANQAIEKAEQLFVLTRYPKHKWDAVFDKLANPLASSGEMSDTWLHGVLDAVRDHIVNVPDDLIHAVTQVTDPEVLKALVGKKLSDKQLRALAAAKTDTSARRILSRIVGDVPYEVATKLTRGFRKDYYDTNLFFGTLIGQSPRPAAYVDDGLPAILESAYLPNELLNRVVPMPDPRKLRQAVTSWRQHSGRYFDHMYAEMPDEAALASNPARAAQWLQDAEAILSETLTKTFKTAALTAPRTGVVILADETTRAAAMGFASLWNPMTYIAHVLGREGGFFAKLPTAGKAAVRDMTSAEWAVQMGDANSELFRAVGEGVTLGKSPWGPDFHFAQGKVPFSKQEPAYLDAWAASIADAHQEPITREVARAIVDEGYVPDGTDVAGLAGVQEWFAQGPGIKYRRDLAAANVTWDSASGLKSRVLADRSYADKYILRVRNRLMEISGGDDRILAAMADGAPFDFQKQHLPIRQGVDDDFYAHLADAKDGIGPATVVGDRTLAPAKTRGLNTAITRWFGMLMDTPAKVLSRAPLFKQFYWKDAQRMIDAGALTREAQDLAIAEAATQGITLKASKVVGDVTLEGADRIAKARALAFVKNYLDFPGEKSNLEDILRNIAPFATPWRDAIAAWGKILAKNPKVARRVQQGVQAAPMDDEGNITIAGFPVTRWASAALGGGPAATGGGFRLQGEASGLNSVFRGLPGAGFGARIAISNFVPRESMPAALDELLNPYGPADLTGGILETFAPGAFDTVRATGLLGRGGAGSGPTDTQELSVVNLAIDDFRIQAASGKYDLADPTVIADMAKRARKHATRLMLLKALGQAFVPTTVSYKREVDIGDGNLVELFKLGEDYQRLLDEHDGDSYAATRAFTKRYGEDLIYATQGKTRGTVFGTPVTVEAERWRNRHLDFAKTYRGLYGYFAPAGGEYDREVANRSLKAGERETVSIEEAVQLANARLGGAWYEQVRRKFLVANGDASLSDAQRDYLAAEKEKIAAIYPGFDTDIPGIARYPELSNQIKVLLGRGGKPGALDHPDVRDTELAETIRSYLTVRQQALDAMERKSFDALDMVASREFMFGVGNDLAERDPSFTTIWNNLFQREVEPVLVEGVPSG